MSFFYRFQELFQKAVLAYRQYGPIYLFKKIQIFTIKNLFGKNFTYLISRGSYSLIWRRVFETYKTKGLVVFSFRFFLVFFFGWIVFFIKPATIDFVADKKILFWYRKNKRLLTVIIPTFQDYKMTTDCIQSIRNLASGKDLRIIVVDDGSSTNVIKMLEKLPVELIKKEKNDGFAKTVNVGLNEVETGDVVILNNDTIVQEGWLETLQFWAYSDPTIGLVGPKLLYPDQTIQWAGTYRNQDDKKWFDHYFRYKPGNFPQASFSHPVIAVTGACMYIKREVIDKVGFLDENFEMAFEDVDYSLRAWQDGFKSVYCPKAVVVHAESKSRGKKQGEREIRSLEYFWKKWNNFFDKRKVTNEKGKLRIIYINQDNSVGGGPRVLFEHLNRLHELGHETCLYTVDKAPDWFELNVPVKTFKNYELLLSDLKEQEAIKVATWWETAQIVWEGSLIKGIPVYFVQDIESSYYHGDYDFQNKVLASYRKEFNYLTTSSWNREELEKIDIYAKTIPPGISEIFQPTNMKRNANTLLAVGRSHYLKNFDLTTKALKLMKKKPILKLFGIEPRLGKLLGVDYVFKPTDQQVASLYKESSVFIQTSLHEGFCLPILEAMASGCVVICTQADGNSDFCIDGKNCLIVNKTDPSDVAKKLDRVFSDEKLRESLINEGLKTAQKYRWDKIIKDIEDYYFETAKTFGNVFKK